MKPTRWAGCSAGFAALVLLAVICTGARAEVQRPHQADVVLSPGLAPPPVEAPWRTVGLPASTRHVTAWYRVAFTASASATDDPWAVYLPYLYRGGRLFLNGVLLAHIQEPSAETVIRWERPHLVSVPAAALRPGANELLLRIPGTAVAPDHMPLPAIGPYVELLPEYEGRLFWIRTMPQFTVLSSLIVGLLALFIWWRRRDETLYGLFGAAAVLWGIRTLTFVIEVLPSPAWQAWRTVYHGATGGFVIVMLLFAMRLAGMRAARLRPWLLGYWVLGPAGYLASGGDEAMIGRWWAGGLLPIGFAVLAISVLAAWRQRTATLVVLCAVLGLAVLAGVHDYLLATAGSVVRAIAPEHAAARVFLLHYAADILLVAMGGILSARFVGTLQAIEQLNRTLERRVAEREGALAENYERLRLLERQNAAGEERQQIMRDLHDGLGSHLFLTLSRVESGQIDQDEMVQALRECIADMRMTLEAMSPESNDFLQAWGNFRFRWRHVLEAAGLDCTWETTAASPPVELSPHEILQLLRIVQEALTNVLKHAHAHTVTIRLHTDPRAIAVEVEDDGLGLGCAPSQGGHGLANMRARATRIGARLDIADQHPGVRVAARLDLGAAAVRRPADSQATAVA